MSRPYLSIRRIERRLSAGSSEELRFEPGVNLLVGRPNTARPSGCKRSTTFSATRTRIRSRVRKRRALPKSTTPLVPS